MNESFWQKTTNQKNLKSLDKDIDVDVLIIGGGLSGIMTAYQLKDSHLKIAVVEKDKIGSHTSGHTTAKVTILHDLIYQRIEKHYSYEHAHLYYQSNKEALHDIKKIIQKEKIDCDFQENIAYIYSDDPRYVSAIEKEKKLLTSFGETIIDNHHHLSTLGLKNQAVFHPLKYLYQIVNICIKHHIQFYEQSQAVKIYRYHDYYKVKVNQNTVTCRYLVHATRYPFIKKGLYFFQLFQSKEYIDYLSYYKGPDSDLAVDQTLSYRPITKKHSLVIDQQSHDWFSQDSIPIRGIPYIGRFKNNEFMIYGFQKWGMTLSHVAARLIKDLILENDNPYIQLYYCHYFSISYSKYYFSKLIKHILKGYIGQRYLTKDIADIKKDEGAIVKIHHRLYAVYRDKNNQYHYFSPYCPHLKCLVHFNHKSHTWDCPCHQSIYDAYGHLIEGPSLSPLKEIVNDEIH